MDRNIHPKSSSLMDLFRKYPDQAHEHETSVGEIPVPTRTAQKTDSIGK